MISAIKLFILRNAEYIQFIKSFLAIVLDNNPTALNVQLQYNSLQAMLKELENIFITEQGSAITGDVTAIDARRDRALTGIIQLVGGYTYHYNPETAKHAETINRQIIKYGQNIARQNYQAETAIIDNLLVDFTNKPEVAAGITALNLDDWKKELEQANTAFNAAYMQRTKQIGAINKDTLNIKRLETNDIYYKLRSFIDSYYTINEGAEPYKKTTNELNALIEQYNTLMAGRGKDDKGGDKDTDKGIDEPPTPPVV